MIKNNITTKVTLISTLPPIKGISAYTSGLTTALSKKIKIDFIGFKDIYPDFFYPGGSKDKNAVSLKLNNNVNIKNILTWYNPLSWIKAGLSIKTKTVHAQWWSWILAPVYLTILSIAKLRGKKIIITIHNVKPHEKSFIKVFLNKSVINLGDEYIVHSENNKQMFLENFKTKKPIHIIPHGIIEMTISKKSVPVLKNKYGFKADDKVILYFGNIREYKGIDILIKALSKIKDERVKLIIAGKPWGTFDEYQDLINKNNLNNRVKLFLEFVSESQLSELFKLANITVYPYKEFEASSGAASVALYFKKPIVVTDVGGLTETVLDSKVIAKPNKVNDLAQKMSYALLNQSKLSSDSNLICQNFLWKNIIVDYLQKVY